MSAPCNGVWKPANSFINPIHLGGSPSPRSCWEPLPVGLGTPLPSFFSSGGISQAKPNPHMLECFLLPALVVLPGRHGLHLTRSKQPCSSVPATQLRAGSGCVTGQANTCPLCTLGLHEAHAEALEAADSFLQVQHLLSLKNTPGPVPRLHLLLRSVTYAPPLALSSITLWFCWFRLSVHRDAPLA